MVNTPPTYNWYLTGLTLEWLKEQGGLKGIEARNIRKAEKLYAAIDARFLFKSRGPGRPVSHERSLHLADPL